MDPGGAIREAVGGAAGADAVQVQARHHPRAEVLQLLLLLPWAMGCGADGGCPRAEGYIFSSYVPPLPLMPPAVAALQVDAFACGAGRWRTKQGAAAPMPLTAAQGWNLLSKASGRSGQGEVCGDAGRAAPQGVRCCC